MIKSNKIKFSVVERLNVYAHNGKEWALNASPEGSGRIWTLKTWTKEPAQTTVDDAKALFFRSCHFYHSLLSIPSFDLSEQED